MHSDPNTREAHLSKKLKQIVTSDSLPCNSPSDSLLLTALLGELAYDSLPRTAWQAEASLGRPEAPAVTPRSVPSGSGTGPFQKNVHQHFKLL